MTRKMPFETVYYTQWCAGSYLILLKTPQFWFFVNFEINESSVPVFGQKKNHNEKIIIMKAVLLFFGAKFCQISTWRFMISTYRNDISWKNLAWTHLISKTKILKLPEYRRILFFFLLSYLVCKPNLGRSSYGWLPLPLHHKSEIIIINFKK
jgi:hypothetical protein